MRCFVLLLVGLLLAVHATFARRHQHETSVHHRHQKNTNSTTAAKHPSSGKYVIIDSQTGLHLHLNSFNKHHPGRHVCTVYKNTTQPVKTKQPYCKPIFKTYTVKCNGYRQCTGVRIDYETHYKDIVTTRSVNEVSYTCCPGWSQVANRSHGCSKPTCDAPCLNGGRCVKPNVCFCPAGFAGGQCEKGSDIDSCLIECQNGGTCVNYRTCKCPAGFEGAVCERDVNECVEMKPCDQICYNTVGSYRCECKEGFQLQGDGQSCRKENDTGTTFEAKDLEFGTLDKRLLKLELMMDETHKNDVSKNDIESIYKDIDFMSKDIGGLKNRFDDMENYKSDMYVFKDKLYQVEKKAEKYEDLLKRISKCVFYSKICT